MAPAIFVVDATNDEITDTDGKWCLREAVLAANALAATADVIEFDAAVFATAKTITLSQGAMGISDNLTIAGPAAHLRVDAAGSNQRFSVAANTALSITNVELANFKSSDHGAVVVAATGATLSLTESKFTNNTTSSTIGGGVIALAGVNAAVNADGCTFTGNSATATGADGGVIRATTSTFINVSKSTFSNNTTHDDGGAVYTGGRVWIESCTFNGNRTALGAGNDGGAITRSGPIEFAGYQVSNSTFSANKAASGGAVHFSATSTGDALITNCTFTLNQQKSATGSGGAVNRLGSVALHFYSCIFADNAGAASAINGPDLFCASPVTMAYCAVSSSTGFTVGAGSDNQLGTTVALLALADNGGPTPTHALPPNSPAHNAGANPNGIATDQRGLPREWGIADIGSYELQPLAAAIVINGGAAQRSRLTHIDVNFNEPVAFANGFANAVQIERTGPGGPIGLVPVLMTPHGNNFTLTFADAILAPTGSLIDGLYSVRILANEITGGATSLPANVVLDTHCLFGDADGDGDVDSTDFGAFRAVFGGTNSIFDFDNDGDVDAGDFGQFRGRFGLSI